MHLTDKQIQEFQRIYEKEYGKKLPRKEAAESAYNLINFFKVLYDCDRREHQLKEKLKKSPKGFYIEEGETYNCLVCDRYITGKEGWYDKYGNKCLICQNALDKKVIPGYICHDRDSRYKMWELKDKFGIHSATARKLVREGKLKARIIRDKNNNPYEYVFLMKENKEFLENYGKRKTT